jgi:anti-sigma B factor antagonist
MLTSTTRVKDNVSIVDLDGKLIAGDAVVLYNAVQGLTGKGASKILINMDGVDLMDSSGLGELTRAGQLASSRNATLKLLNTSRDVRRTLEAAGFLRLFEAFDNETVAVASFRD